MLTTPKKYFGCTLFCSLLAVFFVIQTPVAEAYFGNDPAVTYNKTDMGVLTATEWNKLKLDFVNTWGSSTPGTIGIGITPDVNSILTSGTIKTELSFVGNLSANYVSSGIFGDNTGGGLYSFLGNVGIGVTSTPLIKLQVGSGATGHSATGIYQAGGLVNEFDGSTFFDGAVYMSGGDFQVMPNLYLSEENFGLKYASDFNAIFTTMANRHLNFDHASPTNPSLFIHSALSPDVSNNQWGGITHNATNFVLSTGANTGAGTAPTTIENAITFNPREVEAMRITGAGNVGIGTTNPGAQLEVYKSGTSSEIRMQRNSGGVFADGDVMGKLSNWGYTTSSGSYENANIKFIARSGNGIPVTDMAFSVSNANTGPIELLRLTGRGNVGIGLTNPSARLAVSSNLATPGLDVKQTTSVAGVYNLLKLGIDDWGAANRGLHFQNWTDLAASRQYILYNGYATGTTPDFYQGNYERFSGIEFRGGDTNFLVNTGASGAGANTLVTTTNALSIKYTGNVGIGTNAPAATLDVNGLIKMRSSLITSGEDVINRDYLIASLASTSASVITQIATSSLWQGSLTGNIYSNNTGNVGVGTTSPSQKLHVQGAVGVNNNDTGTILSSYNTSATGYPQQFVVKHNGGFVEIKNERGNIGFTAGNIGIGTTNPNSELHIKNNASTGYLAYEGALTLGNSGSQSTQGLLGRFQDGGDVGNGNSYYTYLGNNAKHIAGFDYLTYYKGNGYIAPSVIALAGNGRIGFLTSQVGQENNHNLNVTLAERMTILQGGNVGIGTNNPGSRLDVLAEINDAYVRSLASSSNQSVGLSLGRGAISQWYLYSPANTTDFRISGLNVTDPFTIKNTTGNVGIGTTNPAGKLDVSAGLASQTAGDLVVDSANKTVYIGTLDSVSGNTTFIFRDRLGNVKSRWENAGSGSIAFSNFGTNYGVAIGKTISAGMTTAARLQVDSGAAAFPAAVFETGNVGIGTTSPAFKLDVMTGFGPYAAMRVGYPGSNLGMYLGRVSTGSYYSYIGDSYYQNGGYWRAPSNTGSAIRFKDAGGIGFFVDSGLTSGVDYVPTERLTVLTNGNVGIGTTNPSAATLVVATSTTNYSIDAGNYRVGNVASPVNNLDAANKSYVDSIVVATTTQGTQFGPWTVGASNSIYNNNSGNIGIGTTTPSDKLGIMGNIGLSPASLIGSGFGYTGAAGGTASYATLQLYSNTTGYTTLNNQGFGIKLQTAGADRFTILNNGNVGIGMTNPGQKLTVLASDSAIPALGLAGGSFSMLDSGVRGLIQGNSSGGNYFMQVQRIDGTATAYNLQLQPNGGNVGIGTTDPGSRFDVFTPTNDAYLRSLAASSTQSVGLAIGRGALSQWYLYSPASTTDFRIHSYNVTDPLTIKGVTGNVGIGTTNPLAKLEINNQATFNTSTPGSAAYYGLHFNGQVTSDYATGITWNGGSSGAQAGLYVQGSGAYGTKMYFATTDSYAVGAKTRMMIDHAGNVGIGTNNPGAYKLNVAGPGLFSSYLNVSNTVFAQSFQPTGVAVDWIGQIRDNSYNFSFKNASSTNLMIITGSGSVGIGTTTPDTATLVVVPPGSGYAIDLNNHSISNVSTPLNPGDVVPRSYVDSIVVATTTQGTQFGPWTVGASNSIYNNNSGNVGIGTSTASQKLTIDGNALINSGNMLYFRDTTTYINEGSGLNIVAGNTRSLNLAGGAGTDLTISSAGLVGIGTTGPWEKLSLPYDSKLSFGASTLYNFNIYKVSSGQLHTYFDSRDDNTTSNIYFRNRTGGTPVNTFTILGTGNVGVGTTDPGSRFDVFTPTNDAYLRSLAASSTQSVGLAIGRGALSQWYLYSPANTTDFRIHSNNVADPFTIKDTTGNVGIGTTTPGYKLDVSGEARVNNLRIPNTSDGGISDVGGTAWIYPRNASNNLHIRTSSGGIYIDTNNDVNFRKTDGTNLVKILSSNGNVGIGTTSPAAKLDVFGSVNLPMGATYGYRLNTNRAMSQIGGSLELGFLDYKTLYPNLVFKNDSTFSIQFNGSDRLFINGTSGKVGIGTTTPSTALQVVGTITADAFSGSLTSLLNASNISSGIFGYNSGFGNYAFANRLSIGWGTASTSNPTDMLQDADMSVKNYLAVGATSTGGVALKVVGDTIITGSLQTQTGADFAEEFVTSEDLVPGTVVVMGDLGYKSVKPSERKNDSTVVGIVSDNPSIIAGKVNSENKAVVAMMGVVKVRATSSNGKIRKGDLLTTSDLSGYAMKATEKISGTVIGKALEDLTGRRGEIKVLVNLQ